MTGGSTSANTAPLADSAAFGSTRGVAPRASVLLLVWLLLLASVVPWRQGDLYRGGFDTVVIIKALASFVALGLAASRPRLAGRHVGPRSLITVIVIAAVGMVGAVAGETTSIGARIPGAEAASAASDISSSFTLTVRLMLIVATIILIAGRWEPRVVIETLLVVTGAIAIVSAASGATSISGGGRLAGVLPPLNPNEIALMSALPLIGVIHRFARGRGTVPLALAGVLLSGVLVASGSRTAIAGTALALVTVVAGVKRPRVWAVGTAFVAVPIALGVIAYTDVLDRLVARGEGVGRLVTLNSRTIAWDAVLSTPENSWAHWWGAGLSTKEVAVQGQYWQYQVLDSSWVSALAQVGVIGFAGMAILAAMALVSSIRGLPLDGLALPLLLFILVRSFLESGLVDSSTAFVLFFTIAVLVEPGSRSVTTELPLPPALATTGSGALWQPAGAAL